MTEQIPNLLRPNQLENQKEEERRLEYTLKQPEVQDRPAVMRQLRAIKEDIERRTPTPFASQQIDLMVQKERELREEMMDGMPTQEEMRRNPPGAVHKLQRWEKLNKDKLKAWKYITMRLNAGTDDPDVANFERYRPVGGSGQMNMDNAQIPKEKEYFIPREAPDSVIFTPQDVDTVKELDSMDPDSEPLAGQLGLLTNEQRKKVMELVKHLQTNPKMDLSFEDDKPAPKMKKGTATLPPAVREAVSKRMVAQRQLGRAKKEGDEDKIAEWEAKVSEMKELELKVKEAHKT